MSPPGLSAIAAYSGRRILTAKHMPKTPKGKKRPADVIGNAVHVMRIATGEIEEPAGSESPAAQLGRLGGKARAKALSAKKRSQIAKAAAAKRWGKKKSR